RGARSKPRSRAAGSCESMRIVVGSLVLVVAIAACEKDSSTAARPPVDATPAIETPSAPEPRHDTDERSPPTDGEPRLVAPPEESDAHRELLARARTSIVAAKGDGGVVLRDHAFDELHPLPSFRALVREHARASRLVIVADDEPGTPIVARGIVVDAKG